MTSDEPPNIAEPAIAPKGSEAAPPVSGESWSTLQFFTEDQEEMPTIASTDAGRFEPSVLFRSRENWLARLQGHAKRDARVAAIREDVRALSAKWLRMQNLSVLMGAGASFYVTGFAGRELFDRVQRLVDQSPSSPLLREVMTWSSKPAALGKRFEEFLSQLAALARLSESASWPLDKLEIPVPLRKRRGAERRLAALRELLLDIERAIAVACNVVLPDSSLGEGSGDPTAHEVLMAKLVARDPQHGRARLFTTNYDTLVEQALDRLGILYADGFSGTVNRRFSPGVYDLDTYYPGEVGEGRVRRYNKVMQLFKLHGSINWRRRQPSATNPFGVGFGLGPIPNESEVLSSEKGRAAFLAFLNGTEGLLILPTASKYAESLTMPFAHMQRSMANVLREPQTVLFVLGYSGWDSHINQIIHDSLTNPAFTVVIVDPTPSPWARRLVSSDYSGRVYCFGGEWGRFEFFAKAVLPDLEVLKTELDVARTLRELRAAQDNADPGSAQTEHKDA